MIGAIVFILSLLVLGFCVISPSTTQKIQETAIGAWDKAGIGKGFNNWMMGLRDQSSVEGPGPRAYGRERRAIISSPYMEERAEGQTFGLSNRPNLRFGEPDWQSE